MIVWSFRPRLEHQGRFEDAYGRKGAWKTLFAASPNYLGSTLLRDAADPGRYVTIDRWRSAAAYDAFLAERQAEYAALDQACAELTESEELVGRFDDQSEAVGDLPTEMS